MNEIQKKCFGVLLEQDRICQLAGLQYYLYSGTLLGAVRHGGFIPWDDDFDCVMLRDQQEKLEEACDKYLDKEHFGLRTRWSFWAKRTIPIPTSKLMTCTYSPDGTRARPYRPGSPDALQARGDYPLRNLGKPAGGWCGRRDRAYGE